MKKAFETPMIECIVMDTKDILTLSDGGAGNAADIVDISKYL